MLTPLVIAALVVCGAAAADERPAEAWDTYKAIKAPMFSGIVTFAHLPWEQCLIEPDTRFDIGVLGLPFDTAASYRTGTRFGPQGIRMGSRRQDPTAAYSHWWKRNPYSEGYKMVDCGDAPIISVDNKLAVKQMEAAYDTLISRPSASEGILHPRLLTFGGDHSILLPILRALSKIHGPITLIQLDSHHDCWGSATKYGFSGDPKQAPVTHGNMNFHAANEGILSQRSVQAGIRTRLVDEQDLKDDEACGFQVITADDIDELGPKGVAAAIRKRVGDGPVYLTFDIDVVDPSAAPATGTPETGGWSSREVKRVLRDLKGLNFVGADIVEVSPPFDTNAEQTQMLAADIGYELLQLLTSSPGFKPSGSKAAHDEL